MCGLPALHFSVAHSYCGWHSWNNYPGTTTPLKYAFIGEAGTVGPVGTITWEMGSCAVRCAHARVRAQGLTRKHAVLAEQPLACTVFTTHMHISIRVGSHSVALLTLLPLLTPEGVLAAGVADGGRPHSTALLFLCCIVCRQRWRTVPWRLVS